MPRMTGGKLLADTVHGYGITHVFFMPYIAPRALMEMEYLGIKRVQTHGEKAAAYMADAYARVKGAPGLCMAQSVGAVNLAAGLQDAWLSCSPVVAITGREWQGHQLRHAYQEVDHMAPFSAVANYSAYVAKPEELSHHLRQAFRVAVSGTPGPTHLDLQGIDGGGVVNVDAELEVVVEARHVLKAQPGDPHVDQFVEVAADALEVADPVAVRVPAPRHRYRENGRMGGPPPLRLSHVGIDTLPERGLVASQDDRVQPGSHPGRCQPTYPPRLLRHSR